MKKEQLQKYAELLAKVGLNVKEGQTVFVEAGLDQPDFVTMVVEECYKAGASDVYVDWSHQPIAKINSNYRTIEQLSTLAPWVKAKWEFKAQNYSCRLWIESEDPDGMKGADQEKLSKARQAMYPQIKPFRTALEKINSMTRIVDGKRIHYNVSSMAMVSVVYSTISPLPSLFFSTAMAYVMSKYQFKGNAFMYGLGLFVMITPLYGSGVSNMVLKRQWGIYDNMVAQILVSPFIPFSGMNFMILYAAFKGLSWSYAEAAFIDGAGNWMVFLRIMLPMMLPTCSISSVLKVAAITSSEVKAVVSTPSAVPNSVTVRPCGPFSSREPGAWTDSAGILQWKLSPMSATISSKVS